MITRFAPSPTGPLHLGHAYSALTVWQVAATLGGTALLRIEDTDSTRARSVYEAGIYEDLRWLGLDWPTPVRRQSDHASDYRAVLGTLGARGLIYPCSCTRRDIVDAGAKPGAEGLVYPGTCRHRPLSDAGPDDALRLNLSAVKGLLPPRLCFTEIGQGVPHTHTVDIDLVVENIGDVVLLRKDTGDPAYHLACVHDDALQEVTHVVRGLDLWALTPLHVILQTILGLPTPIYYHHNLITDEAGKRLAKIDKSKALSKFRAEGATPNDIRRMVGMPG